MVVAVTVCSARPSKALSLLPLSTEMVIVMFWSLSSMSSSTPVTVTVWAVFQVTSVNVNVAGDTVASPVSPDTTANTTLEVGLVVSTTSNVSVEPASSTRVESPDSKTMNAAVSSSVVVAVTVWSARPSKALSLLSSSTAMVIVVSWSPSSTSSSTPVTVTVCGVSQVTSVNVNVAGDVPLTRASSVSEDVTVTTTSEVGLVVSTTSNVSVEPASVTRVEPPDCETVNAAVSSSAVVAVTALSVRPV